MTTTHRVVGPPGCGKTSWLSRQCKRAVERYGEDAALVVSLTKAAAHEAGGRDTGLSPKMIGTLHSHCYRVIGRPTVAEQPGVLKQWNDSHPEFAVSTGEPMEWGEGAAGGAKGDGDKLMSQLGLLRHRMTPRDRWPELVRDFDDLWREFKRDTDTVDFCDMIEMAVESAPLPPGAPAVIFADEAQDFSALELTLLERWGAHVEHVTLVYDPAQALYGWRGADESMAQAEPSIVLSQSYRVPSAVQSRALSIIRQSSTYREAEYAPRDEPGSVDSAPWQLAEPSRWIEEVDDPFEGSTMVLASCGYMLNDLITEMRKRGVAYHNPFSPTRWNPLRVGTKDRRTAVDRLLAFSARADRGHFTVEEIRLLSESVTAAAALRPYWKSVVERLTDNATPSMLLGAEEQMFSERAIEAIRSTDLAWYESALKSANAKSAAYPIAVFNRWGRRLLEEVARADRPVKGAVVVGTIHSVKGGEADRVILFPDISGNGSKSLNNPGWLHRDGVYRMFYVGATRAKSRLIVGMPSRRSASCPI